MFFKIPFLNQHYFLVFIETFFFKKLKLERFCFLIASISEFLKFRPLLAMNVHWAGDITMHYL